MGCSFLAGAKCQAGAFGHKWFCNQSGNHFNSKNLLSFPAAFGSYAAYQKRKAENRQLRKDALFCPLGSDYSGNGCRVSRCPGSLYAVISNPSVPVETHSGKS